MNKASCATLNVSFAAFVFLFVDLTRLIGADWIIDMLSSESRYGFDEFISYAELLDPAKGNLPGGNLTVFCEVNGIV